MAGGIKKWFMLQMWRVQQIAQILSLVMLAVTNALLLYGYMEWREGSFFSTPYVGVLLILLVIGSAIWIAAFIWDMRMKMWREQATVLVERNPYAKEKMSAKEVVMYQLSWLPLMEKLGKDDPDIMAKVKSIRAWIKRLAEEDPILRHDIDQVYAFMNSKKP